MCKVPRNLDFNVTFVLAHTGDMITLLDMSGLIRMKGAISVRIAVKDSTVPTF